MKKPFTPICFSLLFVVVWWNVLSAQSSGNSSATKPPLVWKDVASVKSIGSAMLSSDGKWFAYTMNPPDGDADLVIQKMSDTTKYMYSIGSLSGNTPVFPQIVFSDDGKWICFKVFPKDKEKKVGAKSPGKPLPDKVFLVELATNKKTEFEKVRLFRFNGERSSHLVLHRNPAGGAGAPPTALPGGGGSSAASETPKGSDLLVVELSTGKTLNIGNVSESSVNKSGVWLAYTIDAAEKVGNGVHLRNLSTGITLTMDSDSARYSSLGWTEKGDGLALLKSVKDKKYKNDRVSVLGIKSFDAIPTLTMYNPASDSLSFPRTMTISPNRTPMWTEDLTRLVFGIHSLELAKKDDKKPEIKDTSAKKPNDGEVLQKLRADTTIKSLEDLNKALAKHKQTDSPKDPGPGISDDKPEKPDMVIWHWLDKQLQSRQQVREQQDKNFNYLVVYDVVTKKFTRLADSTLRIVTLGPKHLYGLAQNTRLYELQSSKDGQQFADLVVVDAKTGIRTPVQEKYYLPNFSANPILSPDGTKLSYWLDGHWFVYDILTKEKKNLTATVPTSFIDTNDDHNVRKPPHNLYGWTSDNKFLLAGDGWDVWQIPVDGKTKATNLTQDGKREKNRYLTRFVLDPDEKGIDLRQPQYFRVYGEWTKKSGFAKLESGVCKRLIWEDVQVGDLIKAKKAQSFVFTRQTFSTPREFYASVSTELQNPKKITQNAPQLQKYDWSPGSKLVNYVSDKGDTLQGALFLPAGYKSGKKYPTIVYYYEKLSQTLHSFSTPGYSGTGWNPGVYTSNGYAVFIPDIVYTMNDPGMSAVWCVLPGVKAALQTGVIDETKIGVHGHSWGGYQTSFLITQTSMFKAAAAGAPLTNLISMYNLIYKNSGFTNGQIFEASQGRLVAPWENWEAYYRNSPMHHVAKVNTPLLMLHNDADGAVDFTQGVEFYTALRRLSKPVVMVQYKGENHGLAKLVNRKDYSVRMMEFFDHHIKGKPAPDWLSKGIERIDLDKHLDARVLTDGF